MSKGHTISTLKSRISLVLRRFHISLGLYSLPNWYKLSLRRSSTLRISALLSSFILILIISAIIIPIYNKTEITEAATGTTKESSLSFNLTNSTATVDLSVNDANGTFASSSDDNSKVKFNISTTNYTGYTLSIKGNDNSRQLVNSTNSNIKLNSISSTINYDSFNSNDSYNNAWGYLPSKLNSSTNTNYLPAPTTTATTLDVTGAANSSANTYTIGIGARASYTTPAGEYTGTYILTAVGNPINYTVTYNKNTTDTVSSLPSNVSSSTSQTYITLSNNTPSREGYTFLGWCLGAITTTSNVDSCTGATYQPGNSFYIDQESANLPTLLAMWEKDKVYMQDISLNDCKVNVGTNSNSANIGDNITVYDKRDNKDYTIRYINGECWMTQNLRFTDTSISPDDTNINTSKTLSYSDLSLSTNSSSSGPCYGSSTSGNGYTNLCIKDSGDTSKGVYYNYAAATAGTIIGNSNSANAAYDICPKNWHLPSAPNITTDTDFNKLIGNKTGGWQSATAGLVAFGAIVTGSYVNGSLSNESTYGLWWSSVGSSTKRYYLLYNTSNGQQFGGSVDGYRYSGVAIRCVKTRTISETDYLQDVTSTMVSAMSVGDTATLKDKRDDTSYTVGKLKDNKLWLLDNLALDLTNDTVLNGMNSSNTHATDTALDYLKGNKTGTTSDQYATSKPTDMSISLSGPRIAKFGSCEDAYCASTNLTWSYTDVLPPTINGVTSVAQGRIGIYYNYCAASAGSYCYGSASGTGVTGSPSPDGAVYDICPYGWRLPTGASSGEFNSLYAIYGDITAFSTALNVALTGSSSNSSSQARQQGYRSMYWTSSYYSDSSMYYYSATTSSTYYTHGTSRTGGESIRCIFAG